MLGWTTMSSDAELCFRSIAELERAYAAGELSPVEVTDAYLGRIDALDDRLHAYITVTAEAARAAAQRSEQRWRGGDQLGSLDGVPLALKDLFDTAGVRTTAHSELYADRVPDADATVVRRLVEAGAVPLGKLSMHEFAYGDPGPGAFFPPARNPWDTALMPGGSSSGSGTAVAAGLCAGSVGSDTGGSIRAPASYSGIVGLKPTYGLVSRAGVLPLSWSLDHAGPMTRTVEDAAIMLQTLAGHDPADPSSARFEVPEYRSGLGRDLGALRIGAPIAHVEAAPELTEDTLAAYRRALAVFEGLGASVREVDLPDAEFAAAVVGIIIGAEAFAFHEQDVRERPEKYGPDFYLKLLNGALIGAAEYINALRGRAQICAELAELMRSVDLLVLPTTARQAMDFATSAENPPWARTSFTRLFNLPGQPALSVPCGFSAEGLPIGLQIVGRPFDDAGVLAAAHAYEGATERHIRRPPLDVPGAAS